MDQAQWELFFKVVTTNQSDIIEIANKLGGLPNLLAIMPALYRIWRTTVDKATLTAFTDYDPVKVAQAISYMQDLYPAQK